MRSIRHRPCWEEKKGQRTVIDTEETRKLNYEKRSRSRKTALGKVNKQKQNQTELERFR